MLDEYSLASTKQMHELVTPTPKRPGADAGSARQDLTGAARTWAERYEVGDVLRYSRASKETGIGKGEYARVVDVDGKQNRMTVALRMDVALGHEVSQQSAHVPQVAVEQAVKQPEITPKQEAKLWVRNRNVKPDYT